MSAVPSPSSGATGATVRIIRGRARPAVLAALAVALDAAAGAEQQAGRPATPAWLRAARSEAVGGPAAAQPSDLWRPV